MKNMWHGFAELRDLLMQGDVMPMYRAGPKHISKPSGIGQVMLRECLPTEPTDGLIDLLFGGTRSGGLKRTGQQLHITMVSGRCEHDVEE